MASRTKHTPLADLDGVLLLLQPPNLGNDLFAHVDYDGGDEKRLGRTRGRVRRLCIAHTTHTPYIAHTTTHAPTRVTDVHRTHHPHTTTHTVHPPPPTRRRTLRDRDGRRTWLRLRYRVRLWRRRRVHSNRCVWQTFQHKKEWVRPTGQQTTPCLDATNPIATGTLNRWKTNHQPTYYQSGQRPARVTERSPPSRTPAEHRACRPQTAPCLPGGKKMAQRKTRKRVTIEAVGTEKRNGNEITIHPNIVILPHPSTTRLD